MKKLFLPVLLVSGLVCASAHAETIFDALSATYNTNPTLRAQRAYLRSIDENVALAKSGYRPTIALQGGASTDRSHSNAPYADTKSDTLNGAAVVSQPLFNGF